MISVWRQYWLLLWKSYVIKKKQKVWIVLEIAIPVFLFLLLVLIRTRNFDVISDTCHYDAKSFPSAGILPFMHSLFCSLSNNCKDSPTTADDKFEINQPSDHESLVIQLIRWLISVLESFGEDPNGWEKVFAEIAHLIHVIAKLGPATIPSNVNPANFTPNVVAIPLSILFGSERSMMNILTGDFGMNQTRAELFKNISVTPMFFLNAYKTVGSQNADSITDLVLNLMLNNQIDMFCNDSLRQQSFWSKSGEVEAANLCEITYSDLLGLVDDESLSWINVQKRIIDYYLDGLSNTAEGAVYKDPMKRKNLTAAIGKLVKLPPFDFGPFFGDKEQLLNAIFCGNFFESFRHQTGAPQRKANEMLAEFQKEVQEFVMKLTPGQSHDEHGVKKCGDIVVSNNHECDAFNFFSLGNLKGIKTLLNGYILVSPDVPITRELVRRLNEPLQKLNYFHDLIADFHQISKPLQDAIANSDLNKAANFMSMFLHLSGANQTGSLIWALDHFFQNSSDSNSFLMMGDLMAREFLNVSGCFRFDRFRFMKNESEVEKQAVCLANGGLYLSAIVFPDNMTNSTELSDYTEYKLRHLHDFVDSTDFLLDRISRTVPRDDPYSDLKYLTFGFSFLQEAVERHLVSMFTNETIEAGLLAQQEPYPCTIQDMFNVTTFLSLFLILSWMIPSSLLVKNIVWEKEMRLKEMMRIMGLGDMIHWIAWATQCFVFNFIAILIITGLLKFGNILPKLDVSLLFVFLLLFTICCIAQCLLLTTFFSKANIATAATALLFFLFFVPFQLSMKQRNPGFALVTLIFPQTAVGYGMTMIAMAEPAGLARWETLDAIQLDVFQVSMKKVLVSFAVDTAIYLFLAWYISALFPGTYGIPKKWNFFMTKSYWVHSSAVTETDSRATSTPPANSDDFEVEPNLPLAVEIVDMVKVYNNNTKALDKLSVRFYESQITGFLGHNGAGKTTTISILSGLYTPSKGTAYIYDKDIRTEMSSIRESLGVCPQYNVLFDLMTVEEQLWFYGSLKGVSSDDIDSEVENILMDIDLVKKRTALSSDLSGGMKRKLCIGIALIGGSKLVILDEPTAGIDAHARRSIWQLLLKHKRGRTMILSTHHMDEADVLADRIAIIAEGQLRTAGSALFLKKRFGDGYTLTLARSTNRMSVLPPPYVENPGETLPRKPLDELMEKMTKNRSKFVDDMGTEVVYNLPLDMSAEEMKRLFEELDMKKYDLGIDSYGISAPTLQQIFIRVAPMHELKLKKEQMKTCLGIIKNLWRKLTKKNVQVSNENLTEHLVNNMPEDHSHPPVVTVETKRALLKLHTKALLAKRWHNTRRSVLQMFCLLVCPVLLVLFAELYAKFQQRAGTISYSYDVSQQPLYLTPIIYGNYTEVYFGVWNQKHATVSYLKSMMESPGIGCRCMTNIDLYNDTMDRCLDDYGEGHMNLAGDVASKIPYNVEQKCGCTPNGGWNCTYGDYPIESLQSFTLNTSDRVWDVTFRNISQFRLVNSKNTTRHVNVTLGGWTVGHTNVQSMTEFEMGYAGDGLDTLLASLDSAASVWSLDWENATDGVNWTTSSNPFNPEYGNPKDFFNDTLPSLETEENAKIWFNNKAYAALPINTNSYHNGILRALSSPYKDPEEVGIMTISHPMNKTVEDAVGFSDQLQKTMMFRVVVSVLVLSFIPASACLLLVEERTSFSRHLQSVFGVSPWLYWLTNFIYDYMILNICCLLIVLIYVAMGVEVFTYSLDASYSTFLIFVIYNASVLPCIYVFQMIFTIPSVAYAIIGIGLFFIGVVTSMVILLLENLVSSDDTLVVAHQICSIVFLIVPQYNLGVAISRLNFIYGVYITAEQYLKSIGRRDMLGQVPLPLVSRWDLMGQHFFALIVDGLIFLIILGIIEYKHVIFKFLRRREQRTTRKLLEKYHKDRKLLDEDVQREQTFVENIKNYDDYGLVVKGLSKGYSGEFLAVENLSFAVEKGECFGLLGVNGAGKTSTFSMLTGRLIIGSGDAYIHGNSVVDGGFNSFRLLGYCPQFDALNLRLTAREQLTFYARIRGIREMDIEHIVDWAINQMQLLPYANEVSGSYSGGNKRKLSAAIALVADPPVVLLDEPSAGMDVSSQQFMWNLILQLRRAKRTVIITSHSMEECEALCTRTAIMVHGQFQCIGSIQHLKEKFGQGYTLTIKVVHKEDIERVKEFVRKNIAGSFLQSIHCNTLFYRIRGIHCSLSLAFGAINELQKLLPIEDYQLSQTTLDDVFVSFAAKSENDPADLGDVTFDEIHSPPPDRTQESTDLTDPPNH